jgi:HK97 family phage major capsid protein
MNRKRYVGLLEARAAKVAEGQALNEAADGRALSADEQTAWDAIFAAIARLDGEIEAEERRLEQSAQLDGAALRVPDGAILGSVARPQGLDRPWGYEFGVRASLGADGIVVYGGVPEAEKIAFGSFLQAVHRAPTGRGADPRLLEASKGMNEAVGEDGGFAVPTQFRNDLRLRILGGEILSRIQLETMSGPGNSVAINVVDETSRADGSRFGGVRGYWVEEGGEIPASRPKLTRVEIKPKKVAALGYATSELLQDAALMGGLMTDAFAAELKFQVEKAVISGDGMGKPLGILNSPALVTVNKEAGQAAATVVFQNIAKMWMRLYAGSRSNAVWLINQGIEYELSTMGFAAGSNVVPVYLPANGISGSPFATLYSRPVIPVEYAEALGTVGDVMLVNLSEYLALDKGSPEEADSMHVAFITHEMAFRLTYRIDGQPMWRSALTPYKGANTLSPFVALQTRT